MEQLSQLKSYLHQLVEQLNYTLSSAGGGNASAQSTSSYEVQGGEMSYYDLRSLIIQELHEVERLFDQLSSKMQSEYVSDAEVPQIVNEALAQAKESGEFNGEAGHTPEKGVDYYTEEEINEVAKQAAGKISFTLDEEGNLYYEVEE